MRKPLTEHDATLRSSRKDRPVPDAEDERPLQPVEGGRVRRIVFRGDEDAPGEAAAPPEPEPQPEPEPVPERRRSQSYRPRRAMSIEEIQRAVDRMPRSPGRPFEPTQSTRRERVVYETPHGEVRSSEYTMSEGKRRVIYIRHKKDGVQTERRFVGSEVDRLIADVPDKEVATVRETVTENLREHEPPRPMRKKQRRRSKARTPNGAARSTREAASPRVAALPTPAMLGPTQCRAVTADGRQCRNTAREGAEFCGGHSGYRPPTLDELRRRLDTTPRVKGAPDTLPGRGARQAPAADGYQPQCTAITADGKQCRNSSRTGSKYCGAHRNHRPTDALRARLDTAPRNAKARDTTPKVRGSDRTPRRPAARGRKGRR